MERSEYENLYAQSVEKMKAFIALQIEPIIKRDVEFSILAHVERNKEFYFYLAERGDMLTTCPVTGSLILTRKDTVSQYQKDGVPVHFFVNHYDKLLESHLKGKKLLIINGCIYTIGSNPKDGPYNGSGGREFHIKDQNGELRITYDLWVGGMIHYPWRDQMPDTGEFVTGQSSEGHS